MAKPPRHLILFVKAPRYGAVKTRLARDVGRLKAWTFYRRTLERIVRRLGRGRRWQTWLAVTPDRAAQNFRPCPKRARVIAQGRGELGQRMARAFAHVAPGAAVLIGADIPGIKPAHIAEAFRKLGAFDAVFGPAADGGYWLVGFREPPPAEVFRGVRWSSAHALADTLAHIRRKKIAPMLPVLEDVDDGAALARTRAKNK
jgi:rSAM/selenodomain-associated transferase 1